MIDAIAANAPVVHEVLAQGREEGWAFVALDGNLIESTRSSARSTAEHDAWYSDKHRRHGGNIRVLTDPSGHPVWHLSGRTRVHPRHHRCPRPRAARPVPAAAGGPPTLTDKGYAGAGIGMAVPHKGTTGASLWFHDHADHHMAVLFDPEGPFQYCTPERATPPASTRYPA